MNIKIPGIISTSRLLQVSNAYSNDAEHIIGFSHEMTKFLARQIVGEEISIMKRIYPEVDVPRLQSMISSNDKEMNNLAQTTLYNYTRYTGRIIYCMRLGLISDLEGIVDEYTRLNSMNITDEIL